MKLTTLASTLLFGTSFAAPGTARRWAAYQARAAKKADHGSHTMIPAGVETNITNVDYSSNWGGAVLRSGGYTSVTGSFTVPTPQSDGSGTAWVGIDGYDCQSAILQTGVDWTLSDGSYSYVAWYEWFPDYQYNFDMTVNAGDSITTTVTATGANSGTATVTNNSNGQSQTFDFENQTEGSLCNDNAEWIVEDYSSGGGLVPFADYGTVTFNGCTALQNGNTVDTSGADVLYMSGSDGSTLSVCSNSGQEVTCNYQ